MSCTICAQSMPAPSCIDGDLVLGTVSGYDGAGYLLIRRLYPEMAQKIAVTISVAGVITSTNGVTGIAFEDIPEGFLSPFNSYDLELYQSDGTPLDILVSGEIAASECINLKIENQWAAAVLATYSGDWTVKL